MMVHWYNGIQCEHQNEAIDQYLLQWKYTHGTFKGQNQQVLKVYIIVWLCFVKNNISCAHPSMEKVWKDMHNRARPFYCEWMVV